MLEPAKGLMNWTQRKLFRSPFLRVIEEEKKGPGIRITTSPAAYCPKGCVLLFASN